MRAGAFKERKLEVKGFCGHEHGMHGFKEPSYSTRHPSMAAWVSGLFKYAIALHSNVKVVSPRHSVHQALDTLCSYQCRQRQQGQESLRTVTPLKFIGLYGILSVIINEFNYLMNYIIYRVWKSQRPKPSKPNAATIRRKSSCHPRLFHLNGYAVGS